MQNRKYGAAGGAIARAEDAVVVEDVVENTDAMSRGRGSGVSLERASLVVQAGKK